MKVMKISGFFKEVGKEAKRVTWPSKKELNISVLTVVISVLVFAVIFALLDSLIYNLVRFLVTIGG
jgi:preprotein translocase subunit SecE